MPFLTGATGFDPTARRRVRRAGARLRPWLLPVAVVLAALVFPLRIGAPAPPPPAVAVPQAPPGHVLVAVTPSDPAVLGLAVPGSRVDVYAAAPVGLDGPDGRPADRVADAALVVDPTGGAPAGSTSSSAAGPLSPAATLTTGPATGGAVTLAVTDVEAAALAARPGTALTLAVRPPDAGAGGPAAAGTG